MGVGQRVQSEVCSRAAERTLAHVRYSVAGKNVRFDSLP